jgi:hypothetical protein
VTAQRLRGANPGSVLSSHRTTRHTPRHAPRHSSGYRRRPSRLTLAVAAATVASAAVVASISVGMTLAAANGPSTSSQAAGHVTLPAQRAPSSSNGSRRAGYGRADAARAVAGKAASGKTGSGKTAPAKSAQHKVAAAVTHKGSAQSQPAAAKAQASKAKPYLIYDSVVPQAIPAGQVVATYSTGAHPIPVSAVAGRRRVIWIDTLGTDPSGSNELDIEPGCASPSQAAGWVRARLTAHPNATAILYSSISTWSEIRADVASLPAWMRAKIRWWIADPTGSPHMVPGAQATQWYWGSSYDISTALPGLT